MQEKNLNSTDYDVEKITNYDRRFEAGRKDAVFFHVLGVVAVIIATVFMYALGSRDPQEMTYLFGLPLWFTGGVIIYLAMFVIGMIYLGKWESFTFDAREVKKNGGNK